MATNNTVYFTINLNGNAYNGVVQLSNAVNQTLNPAILESESLLKKVGNACFWLNSIFDMVGRTVGRVVGKLSEFEQAGRAQAEAETKLAQVMRNTMSDDIVRRYGNVEAALNRDRNAVEVFRLQKYGLLKPRWDSFNGTTCRTLCRQTGILSLSVSGKDTLTIWFL